MDADLMAPSRALTAWAKCVGPAAKLESCDDGLINRTFFVGDPPNHVVQWVNPIFDRRIQDDIDAVTGHLATSGLMTPRLVRADDGALAVADRRGFWRLMTFIPGRTHHRLRSVEMAYAVGRLVGRFHAALAVAEIKLEAPPRRIHQTPARLEELRLALESCDGHPLAGPARELGTAILSDWAQWQGELDLRPRLCHGDLKVSNIRFAHSEAEAICLLDLDTLGFQDFAAEMGDAWRSWCNPALEDQPESTRLDIDLFAASARAWLASAPPLDEQEKRALVPGIERIALELAARFCVDIVSNSYFREDQQRFPEPGQHNLLRARAQLALARSAREQQAECEEILEGALR